MYLTKLQPHSDPLTLSKAEEILRRLCRTNNFREALAIDEELRRLRTAVEYLLDHTTDEYDKGFEQGRLAGEDDAKAFERAQVVAYMRANWEDWPVPGQPARDFTAEIERGEHIAEIAAERDALRSCVAELERERDAQRATRRSALAQAFAAAMLAEHREDNLPWDEIMRRAFDAADVFLATEKESK